MGVSYDHHHPVLYSLETLRGLGLQVSLKMKEKNSFNSPSQKFAEGLRAEGYTDTRLFIVLFQS